jgi:hypothetical protein
MPRPREPEGPQGLGKSNLSCRAARVNWEPFGLPTGEADKLG